MKARQTGNVRQRFCRSQTELLDSARYLLVSLVRRTHREPPSSPRAGAGSEFCVLRLSCRPQSARGARHRTHSTWPQGYHPCPLARPRSVGRPLTAIGAQNREPQMCRQLRWRTRRSVERTPSLGPRPAALLPHRRRGETLQSSGRTTCSAAWLRRAMQAWAAPASALKSRARAHTTEHQATIR